MILDRQAHEGWGARVIDHLAEDLQAAFPEMRGLSPRNLKYMRAFAGAWPDPRIVQRTVAQLPTLFGGGHYGEKRAELEAIHEAIEKQQCVRIDYATPGERPESRVIDPYCTWFAAGRVYVIAYCHKAEDTRTFAVQRIKHAQVLDETFDPDPTFDPAAFTRKCFGVFQPITIANQLRLNSNCQLPQSIVDSPLCFPSRIWVGRLRSWLRGWMRRRTGCSNAFGNSMNRTNGMRKVRFRVRISSRGELGWTLRLRARKYVWHEHLGCCPPSTRHCTWAGFPTRRCAR